MVVGALSPETEDIEQLVVDTLDDLADSCYPLSELLGPGFAGVAFGRMDELRSVFFKPAGVVFGSLEALIGHIGRQTQRTNARHSRIWVSPYGEEGLSQGLVGRGSRCEQKPVITPEGSTEINSENPSYQPRLLDQPM